MERARMMPPTNGPLGARLALAATLALGLAPARAAFADDAGLDATTVDDSGGDTGAASPSFQGLGCDGGLCDTTNGAELGGGCAVAERGAGAGRVAWLVAIPALALASRGRRRRAARRP
jgi:hypothetical protein